MEADIITFRDKFIGFHVVIKGDLNARTASLTYDIENDDPKYLPVDEDFNYNSDDNILPRVSPTDQWCPDQ